MLLSSLGSRRHGYTTNGSSGYKSRCCSRLWTLGDTATPPTAAAATRAAAALVSGLLATRLHHQQQQRLQEPLLLSSLDSGRHGYTTNSSSGYKSRCCSHLWALGDTATPSSTAAATRAVGRRRWEYEEGGQRAEE